MRNKSAQALERAKLKRRVAQLEDCLRDVQRWISDRDIEFNSHGADNDDNEDYKELMRLSNRIARTLKPRFNVATREFNPADLPKLGAVEIKYRTSGSKYRVKLDNRGNPDYRQDSERRLPGTPYIEANTDTLVEARELCARYIALCDLGGGNWTGGEVTRLSDNVVIGKFSYNGRLWTGRPKEVELSPEQIDATQEIT